LAGSGPVLAGFAIMKASVCFHLVVGFEPVRHIFLRGAGGAVVAEFAKGAEILTRIAGPMETHAVEPRGVFGEGLPGAGGAFGGTDGFDLLRSFGEDGDLLHALDAALAPAGDGEGFDESGFDFGLGVELDEEGIEERVEAADGFAFEQDGFGEGAGSDAAGGGVEFALGCDGSSGFGPPTSGSVLRPATSGIRPRRFIVASRARPRFAFRFWVS